MATILDRIPVDVDRITAEAREVHVGRTLLTLIAVVLFGIGWVTARACMAVWFGLAWAGVAVKVGFVEGRRSAQASRKPTGGG